MGLRRIGSTQRTTQRTDPRPQPPPQVRERAARDARMLTVISGAPLPYTPWVMSWLSTKLDKPSKAITQADVEGIVAHAHVHTA